ncbi:hypothetical protein BM221_001058 [Beauveria bassiana]|uniref:Uncharacterized protein n=1 Tax=Beauveria bassiana TaxID=176275 RepID=A0A2N6P295_BEABA|nr:hypothetical protein BM221_001058 [Beauveria bassiana]
MLDLLPKYWSRNVGMFFSYKINPFKSEYVKAAARHTAAKSVKTAEDTKRVKQSEDALYQALKHVAAAGRYRTRFCSSWQRNTASNRPEKLVRERSEHDGFSGQRNMKDQDFCLDIWGAIWWKTALEVVCKRGSKAVTVKGSYSQQADNVNSAKVVKQ